MGGLGVSSACILALPAFFASAFGASYFPTTIFLETIEDVSFTNALEKWLSLTNEQKSPFDGTRKNWTQLVYVKTVPDLISRMVVFLREPYSQDISRLRENFVQFSRSTWPSKLADTVALRFF